MHPTKLDISRAVIAACNRISASCRSIEQTTEVERLQDEIIDLGAKKGWESRVIPEMRWEQNDLTPKNCFYIVCRNEDRSLSAICGAKLLDLGRSSYADFLPAQYARLHGGGKIPIDKSHIGRELHEITGRIAYLADFKLYPGSRPRINPTDLVIALYGLAILEFDPDWVIGFLRADSVRRGLTGHYLANFAPMPLKWKWPVEGRRDDDHLLMMPRARVEDIFVLSRQNGFRPLNEVESEKSTSLAALPRAASASAG